MHTLDKEIESGIPGIQATATDGVLHSIFNMDKDAVVEHVRSGSSQKLHLGWMSLSLPI